MPVSRTPIGDQLAAVALVEMRAQGAVSAAVADLVEDPKLDARATRAAVAGVKASALADAARVVCDDPKRGSVGEWSVEVGRKFKAVLSDPHVDERGRFGVTVSHPDLPAWCDTPFYFNNPPVVVVGVDGVRVEDPTAAVESIVAEALRTVWDA